jgi:hypothetical protein
MPVWNDQAMTRVDRVTIVMGESQLVLDDDFRFTAKDTILVIGHIFLLPGKSG